MCATTNYDRSLEMAFSALKLRARTGFYYDGVEYPQLLPAGLGAYQDEPAILHLHGAVGWYRNQTGEIVEYPATAPYSPTNGLPAVLYPSNNKVVEDSIVRAIWVEFDSALDAATHILVLGHSLADKHLVDRLRSISVPLGVTALTEADESKIKLTVPHASILRLRFSTNPRFKHDVRAWMTERAEA
ncbi:MAG: SIR2 family protein [Solirubrobacteraceae bacterium]